MKKKIIFELNLKRLPIKKNKKSIKGPISPKWTKAYLIRLNRNCLIFRENKLSSVFLQNKLYIILHLQNNYLFPRIV